MELRVCVDVDDLEEAIAFYRDGLGLTPGRRLGKHWVEILGGTSPIDLLFEKPGTSRSSARRRRATTGATGRRSTSTSSSPTRSATASACYSSPA